MKAIDFDDLERDLRRYSLDVSTGGILFLQDIKAIKGVEIVYHNLPISITRAENARVDIIGMAIVLKFDNSKPLNLHQGISGKGIMIKPAGLIELLAEQRQGNVAREWFMGGMTYAIVVFGMYDQDDIQKKINLITCGNPDVHVLAPERLFKRDSRPAEEQ